MDTERYYSYSRFLKEYFGEKIYRICLDGGFTCPNRDGKLGWGGCLFCSEGGSGEYAESRKLSVTDQIKSGRRQTRKKYSGSRYIAYFQAFSGTYGTLRHLREVYEEAMAPDEIAALSIATRPDCLSDKVIGLLRECNNKKPVFVEMGLQTCHDATAQKLRRCYPTSVFCDSAERLHEAGIRVTAHLIVGLPGETRQMQYQTVDFINSLPVSGVKLSMLYVLKNTDLGRMYEKEPFPLASPESYTSLVIGYMERFRPDIVMERITGDAPRHLLIGPKWGIGKGEVINRIRHEMKIRDTWQGRLYEGIHL